MTFEINGNTYRFEFTYTDSHFFTKEKMSKVVEQLENCLFTKTTTGRKVKKIMTDRNMVSERVVKTKTKRIRRTDLVGLMEIRSRVLHTLDTCINEMMTATKEKTCNEPNQKDIYCSMDTTTVNIYENDRFLVGATVSISDTDVFTKKMGRLQAMRKATSKITDIDLGDAIYMAYKTSVNK